MADYFEGSIRIGGELTKELRALLVDRLANYGGIMAGEDGNGRRAVDMEEEINTAIENGEAAVFHDDQASYGHFAGLEAFLRAKGIPYDQHAEEYVEHEASWQWWRPGMTGPKHVKSDSQSRVLFEVTEIEEILNKEGLTDTERVQKFRDLIGGSTPPPLPPLSMAKEEASG